MKGRQVVMGKAQPSHIYRKTVITMNIPNTRFSLSNCKITDKSSVSKDTFLNLATRMYGNAQSESRVHIS